MKLLERLKALFGKKPAAPVQAPEAESAGPKKVKRVCKGCGREEETTWAGLDFFCSHCRGSHR